MIASSSTFLRFGPTLSVCSAGRTQRVAAARAATGFSICHLLNRLTRLGRLIANVLVEGVDDDAPLRNAAHDGERSQFRSSLGRQSQADLRIVLDHLTGAKTRWWSTDFRSRWFLTHTIRFLIGDSSYQPIETGSTSVPAYCRDFWLGPRSCSAVRGLVAYRAGLVRVAVVSNLRHADFASSRLRREIYSLQLGDSISNALIAMRCSSGSLINNPRTKIF